MAEIRCPMCGKPNPDNLDNCQFCQARLKPLIAPSEESIIPDQSESDAELPDWFVDSDSDFDDTADDTPFEGETDDWMTRLGDDSEPEEPSAIDESRAAARMDFNNNGIPDWLEDLDADRATPPPDNLPESGDPASLSWLSADEESEAAETLADQDDLPDWLSGLSEQEEDASSGDPLEADALSPAIADDAPDWLTPSSDEETDPPAEAEGGLPDWLSDMGSEETPALEETIPYQDLQPPDSGDADDLPDWLTADADGEALDIFPSDSGDPDEDASGYIGQETIPIQDFEADEPAPAEAADLPEWLSDSTEESESVPPATESDLPEWLSGMDAAEAAPLEEDAPDLGAEDAGLPDWLSDLSAQEEAQAKEAPKPQKPFDMDTGVLYGMLAEDGDDLEGLTPVAGDLPAQQLDSESQTPSIADAAPQLEPQTSSGEPEDESLPDWLSGEDESERVVPAAAEDDLPDWLAGFDGEEEETPPETPVQQPQTDSISAAESDLPDWLAEDSSAESERVASSTEDDDDLPAWLAGFDEQEEASTESAVAEEAPLSAGEDLPDWLSDQSDETAVPATLLTPDDDLPDEKPDDDAGKIAAGLGLAAGLASVVDDRPADHEDEVESITPSAGDDEIPDWLSGIEGVETPLSEEVGATALEQDEVPDWLSDMGGEPVEAAPAVEENLPDWLSDVEGIAEVPESEPELRSSAVDESRAVPDWLRDSEMPSSVTSEEGEAEPVADTSLAAEAELDDDLFEMDQLADWISDESPPDPDSAQEKTGPIDGLEPAELPGWLAAMRPVESVASDAPGLEKRGAMENAGPLAGLYGVLAAEPEISRLKKPPVYSSKLNITDAQQAHANVLHELLEAESQPQALPSPPLISSQRVFRTILSVIMVVVAFVAVLAGSEIATMPTPGNIPPGVEQTRNLVNSLTQDGTALLAFDYEPGLAGEMDSVSAAVVDHMMLKGVKLALVSTSPTGPALAERFISDIQGNHGYVSGSQYVNLGYVPGGVTGLGAFARSPRWVFPDTLDGEPAWGTEPLKNIASVSDFSLVVLITDNPNTARAWVEQVNPELEMVPLIALVSAQAEPMVRPYFYNQQTQIDGLVSGLTGGAAYEVMTRPNIARTYWDAFNILLIVAVSAILIGGCITIISTSLARRKESEGEAA